MESIAGPFYVREHEDRCDILIKESDDHSFLVFDDIPQKYGEPFVARLNSAVIFWLQGKERNL